MQKKESVLRVIKETVRKHGVLSAALLGVVCGAVIFALLPPLVLAQLIDLLTKKHTLWMEGILLYFGLLALTGLLESARESLLTVFGQKITHALRSSLMEKFGRLSANELNRQEPGALVSRFVGDVDTVENLFTSGIISMFADACKILSILAVIWVTNRGLTIVLIILLPVLFLFTRYVQKNMLASQIANRRAVSRASGHVPETLHNIRTIHCLQKETYMEQQYAHYIDDSYSAMEKTNFLRCRLFSGHPDFKCHCCCCCHAAFGLRQSDRFKAVLHVRRNRRCCYKLYFPDLCSGRKSWYGNPDNSVCVCRYGKNQ